MATNVRMRLLFSIYKFPFSRPQLIWQNKLEARGTQRVYLVYLVYFAYFAYLQFALTNAKVPSGHM